MSRKLKPGLGAALPDAAAEAARRNHEERIDELQRLPAAALTVVAGVQLADGIETPVAHKLGRIPLWVGPSIVRGATASGRIVERITGDRARVVMLTATGYGATITLDLAVL